MPTADVPAGIEVGSIVEWPLPDEMDNSQDVIVRPDNDINGGIDMELEASQERQHSSSELTGNEPPQQNVTSALIRYIYCCAYAPLQAIGLSVSL